MYEYAIYMHVEFYGVCIVGSLNGTRCRDGVKVLWSCSHSFCLFFYFYGSIPTMACFHSENFFGTCSCCLVLLLLLLLLFFVLLFRNSKREEAGGEAEGKMRVYKV